jgi:hypothetical protein
MHRHSEQVNPYQCIFFVYRECIGIHLAKSTLWIVVASVLATFNFNKAKDECGRDIEVSTQNTGGLVRYVVISASVLLFFCLCRNSHPVPFECDIRPRDDRAVELLKHPFL